MDNKPYNPLGIISERTYSGMPQIPTGLSKRLAEFATAETFRGDKPLEARFYGLSEEGNPGFVSAVELAILRTQDADECFDSYSARGGAFFAYFIIQAATEQLMGHDDILFQRERERQKRMIREKKLEVIEALNDHRDLMLRIQQISQEHKNKLNEIMEKYRATLHQVEVYKSAYGLSANIIAKLRGNIRNISRKLNRKSSVSKPIVLHRPNAFLDARRQMLVYDEDEDIDGRTIAFNPDSLSDPLGDIDTTSNEIWPDDPEEFDKELHNAHIEREDPPI